MREARWVRTALLAASLGILVPILATAQENSQQDLIAAFYGPPDLTMLTYYSAGWTHLGFNSQYPDLLKELNQTQDPIQNSFSHGWGALVTIGQLVAVVESTHAGTSNAHNQRTIRLSTDDLSLQIGYAALKLPAATGFIAAGAGLQTVGLRGYPETAGTFNEVVVERNPDAFEISARTLILKASAGFELAILPPGDPWGLHAGIIAGVAYSPIDPKYRLFGSSNLFNSAPELTSGHRKLTPWAFGISLILGVGGGL